MMHINENYFICFTCFGDATCKCFCCEGSEIAAKRQMPVLNARRAHKNIMTS